MRRVANCGERHYRKRRAISNEVGLVAKLRLNGMNRNPERRWLRFSLRTVFVGVTVFGCWLAYELDWIRQRHALLAEDRAISDNMSNYANGATSDEIPPVGSTLWQRIVQRLFGEPDAVEVWVWFIIGDEDPDSIVDEDGDVVARPTVDYPKVRRAQRLFPEAKLVAVWVSRDDIRKGVFTKHYGLDLDRLISK